MKLQHKLLTIKRTLAFADRVPPKFHIKNFHNTDNRYPVSVRLHNPDKSKSLVVSRDSFEVVGASTGRKQ